MDGHDKGDNEDKREDHLDSISLFIPYTIPELMPDN